MPIKGLSQRRRLPRLGKIHLGVKETNANGKEYPDATDHFVLPEGPLGEEIAKHFGDKPKSLDVVFPVDDDEQVAPQYYKCYRSGVGLFCKGDGETAQQVGPNGELVEVECPCSRLDDKTCKQMLNLMFMIPQVSMGGVMQIDTSSINGIININSGLDMIRSVAGRISMVPCRLVIEPREATVEGRKKTIHVMNLTLATPDRIKLLSDSMAAIRASVSGCALPSPQQAPFEETHLIPASVQSQPVVAVESSPFIDEEPDFGPGDCIDQEPLVPAAPRPAPAPVKAATPPPPSQCISEKQVKFLFSINNEGTTRGEGGREQRDQLNEELRTYLLGIGIEHTDQIPKTIFDKVLQAIPTWNPKAADRVAKTIQEHKEYLARRR